MYKNISSFVLFILSFFYTATLFSCIADKHLGDNSSSFQATKTIGQLENELNTGKITSEELVQQYLNAIDLKDKGDSGLNSIISTNPNALEIARQMDKERKAGRLRGPLHGIPIVIKDNIETADPMPTTAGSLALKENYALQDAHLVLRLKKAGAIILGKANLSEWSNMRSGETLSGWSAMGGLTKNPFDRSKTASGSSGGSAVAVAAGFAPVAVGTDTNGSITNPASINGVVGFRPTLGLISRSRVIPIGSSQDAPGPMSLTVSDAALLLNVMAGTDEKDSATLTADINKVDYLKALNKASLKGRRFGIMQFSMQNYQPEVIALFDKIVDLIKASGGEVVGINDFKMPEGLLSAAGATIIAKFKTELNNYLASTPITVTVKSLDELIVFNKRNAEKELAYFGQEYLEYAATGPDKSTAVYYENRARSKRLATQEGIDLLMKKYAIDALIAPTFNTAWDLYLTNSKRGPEASVSSLPAIAGYPHLSIPMGLVKGLPAGISLIGTKWSDADILSYGFALEQIIKFNSKEKS